MTNEQNAPDLSQMLSKVMSNPQAMAMFSSLLGTQMNPSDDRHREDRHDRDCDNRCRDDGYERCEGCHRHEDADFHDGCKDDKPILPPAKRSCAQENRRRLLMALRPYLPPERCQALDRILMIAEALALLQSEKRQ